MASFVMKQMVGGKINEMKGGLDNLTGGGDEATGEKTETGEDPEVIQARLEAEERRKEKHRKMEQEREGMRQGIRDKYNIKKKEDQMADLMPDVEGRIGATKRKSPEELAKEKEEEENSLIGQLGLTEHVNKAKEAVTGVTETLKGFLPFGK